MSILRRPRKAPKFYNDEHARLAGFTLALSHYADFAINGDTDALQNAYKYANRALEINSADLASYLLTIILNCDLNEPRQAKEGLNLIKPMRAYFKTQDNDEYAAYLFASAYYTLNYGIGLFAKGSIKQLVEWNKAKPSNAADCMIAYLLISFTEEIEEAVNYLDAAYDEGYRGVFLYITLGKLIMEKQLPAGMGHLFGAFAAWGATHNLDMPRLLEQRRQYIKNSAFAAYPKAFEKVYEGYKADWLLELICADMIKNDDISENAYTYYREYAARQLEFKGSATALIRAAYKHNRPAIPPNAVASYLREQKNEVEFEQKPFLYAAVLRQKALSAFVEPMRDQILAYADYALENGLRTSEHYTIYLYCIRMKDSVPEALLNHAMRAVFKDLFKIRFSVPSTSATRLLILDPDKRRPLEIDVKNNECEAIIAGDKYTVMAQSDSGKYLFETEFTAARLIEQCEIGVYLTLFNSGYVSDELLIALCKAYIGLENCPDEAIPVFEAARKLKVLSKQNKNAVTIALANAYAVRGKDKKAVTLFAEVEEQRIPRRYLDQMLLSHILDDKFDTAVKLINRYSHYITDKTLNFAVKELSATKRYDAQIATAAYTLLKKTWYDADLKRIVLQHFSGSLAAWLELWQAFATMGILEPELDAIILNKALNMRVSDSGVQRVFRQAVAEQCEKNTVLGYAIYLIYEIIRNEKMPDAETLVTLEELYKSAVDNEYKPIWGYGLVAAYASGMRTPDSEAVTHAVLDYAAANGVIWAFFAQLKDKGKHAAYIDKNHPFVYTSEPGKTVKLYYLTEGAKTYRSVDMTYQRFGLYTAHIPAFYGAKVQYFFSEQMHAGSVNTKVEEIVFDRFKPMKTPPESSDVFYRINEALTLEAMFRYEAVEEIIQGLLREEPLCMGELL